MHRTWRTSPGMPLLVLHKDTGMTSAITMEGLFVVCSPQEDTSVHVYGPFWSSVDAADWASVNISNLEWFTKQVTPPYEFSA